MTAAPGCTEMLLDQRHLEPDELAAMLAEAGAGCEQAGADHGCEVELQHPGQSRRSRSTTAWSASRARLSRTRAEEDTAIPSGPLHDAAEMARLIPTVMLFSSSSPPVSHTKEEDTPEADLRVLIDAYGRTVQATLESAAAGDLPPRE